MRCESLGDSTLPKWCEDKIACCVCGFPVQINVLSQSINATGNCSSCGETYKICGNQIQWGISGGNEQGSNANLFSKENAFNKSAYGLIRWIGKALLFPLRRLKDIRIDSYYKRTLNDKSLAAMWKNHYFNGLNIGEGAEVFEHGCGKGRHIGLLNQSGFKTAGLDIISNTWWDNFPNSCFHVVPANCCRLPWKDNQFDIAISFLAISHFSEETSEEIIKEMQRIIRPSGYLLIFEANTESYGADLARKWYGRLHSPQTIRDIAVRNGFKEIDFRISGFASPFFPQLINFVRTFLAPWPLTMMDHNSWLSKLLPEMKRDRWLLRLSKT